MTAAAAEQKQIIAYDFLIRDEIDRTEVLLENRCVSAFMVADDDAAFGWESNKMLTGEALQAAMVAYIERVGQQYGLMLPELVEATPIYWEE